MCFAGDSGLKKLSSLYFWLSFRRRVENLISNESHMFLIFLPALGNPPGSPCEAAQLVFCGRCLFSRVIRISRKIISGMNFACNWTNSHMMAYWSKTTVLFAGPQKHQCSIFMVINICCFSFSNLLFLNVDNSQLSELGNCIFCFGEFFKSHLKLNFSLDFFRSGITKFPKSCFWIFEFEIEK